MEEVNSFIFVGFAFIEFSDDRDAKDAVRDMDGRYILDKKVRVEVSRRGRGGAGGRAGSGPSSRGAKVRTDHRVKILGLPSSAHWQSLKEFLRDVAEPAFVDTIGRGEGIAEFSTSSDADLVVSKLHDTKYEGSYITVKRDGGGGRDRFDRDRSRSRSRSRDRDRDRSRDRDREKGTRSGRDRSRS